MKKHLFEKLKKDLQSGGFNKKSIVAMVVFGAIVIVFIFFGYGGKHATGTGAVAQVNAKLISIADLREETNRVEQAYAPMFGGKIQGEAQRQFIRQQALENLVNVEVMAQGARRAGIRIANREILDVVTRDIPAFQENGKFQRERYFGVLQANRWTAGEFEERVRKERETSRLRRVMEMASTPISFEMQKVQASREMKRNVEFVKIEKATLGSSLPVPASELQKSLADASFLKKVQEEFEQNKASFATEEEVRAQHILIKSDGTADSDKAALAKIETIAKRAQKEDFGRLAAELSDDVGSKVKQGDLGFFTRGRMVPEFEKAAFSQKVGSVGQPVKSSFGYHLIKVLEHKPAEQAKFEKVKEQLAKKMIASEKFDASVKDLEGALQSGERAAIEKSVAGLGLKWEETGFFDFGADQAPKLNSVEATTIALELSPQQVYPKTLARDGGALYLVKWKADKKEALPAAENIRQTLVRENSYDLMNRWIEAEKKASTIHRNNDALMSR